MRSEKKLKNYWFATGIPTILTRLIKKYKMDPETFDKGFPSTLEMFDSSTETATNPVPILFRIMQKSRTKIITKLYSI